MTKINWDEAPEGAQRCDAALNRPWLKKDKGEKGAVYWWNPIRHGWVIYLSNDTGLPIFNEATPRPTEHLPLFQTEQGEEIERLKAEIERLRNAELEAYARTARTCRAYASHAHDEGRREAYTLIAVDCERIAASIDGAASKGEANG
jgi:hypothetical protein